MRAYKWIPNPKFKRIYRLKDEKGRILTYGVKEERGKMYEYNTLKEARLMALKMDLPKGFKRRLRRI